MQASTIRKNVSVRTHVMVFKTEDTKQGKMTEKIAKDMLYYL
jgi:uncharacterized protein YwbE